MHHHPHPHQEVMQILYLQVYTVSLPALFTVLLTVASLFVSKYALSYFQLSCQSPIVVGGGVDWVGGGDTEGGGVGEMVFATDTGKDKSIKRGKSSFSMLFPLQSHDILLLFLWGGAWYKYKEINTQQSETVDLFFWTAAETHNHASPLHF